MVSGGKTTLQRVVVQVLFDGGFRIGELLSVRLKHVTLRPFKNGTKQCFVIRIPFSKTQRRTVVLPMEAITVCLTDWLKGHPAHPRVQGDGTFTTGNVDMPLFPMTANSVRCLLRRVGKEILGKRVYPHLLRHSSATFWSNRLPYFKMCKRFGWSMTSAMPKRYIDREGVDELEVAEIYYAHQKKDEETKVTDESPPVLADSTRHSRM